MKVVCCKNCGAKYQLDDNDDISIFECNSCAGDLELCYEGSSSEFNNSTNDNIKYKNQDIAQCIDCGLKYKIDQNENILDYECSSCGGSLRYLNDDSDKNQENTNEKQNEDEIKYTTDTDEISTKTENNYNPTNTLKSIPHKFEHYFSEEHIKNIVQEDNEEKTNKYKQTAKTKIPQAIMSKFGKEFSIPKSNDYNVLKNYLKEEYYKKMLEYYDVSEIPRNLSLNTYNLNFLKNLKNEALENKKRVEDAYWLFGIALIIFIISLIEIILINTSIGIFGIIIAIIIAFLAVYKFRDKITTKKRMKIIRDHLLTLPEDYYVFYDVELPNSAYGINHLVVGPTGIYVIISQKYNSKTTLNSDNENNHLIGELEETRTIEEIITPQENKFRYATKLTKFPQDNQIKQKALTLGENLINFLNENGISSCFVEPLVGFVNNEVVVINMPLTDEDLFIDELLHKIEYGTIKLDKETIDKCAVLLSKYAADCSEEEEIYKNYK